MALSPLDLALSTIRDLSGNWVRSGLTTLGIFMGVMAVNATLNIDRITATMLDQKLASRDHPFIAPQVYSRDKPRVDYDPETLAALERAVPGVLSISQFNWLPISQVQYLANTADVDSMSVSENYQRTTGRKILQGRFFNHADFDQYRPVAIIDTVLTDQLFEGANPIGEGIFADGTRLTVIGVSEAKSNWESENPTGSLWVPTTYGTILQGPYRSWGGIQIAFQNLNDYKTVKANVEKALTEMFPGYNTASWSNAEDLYQQEQQQRASTRILRVVGLLALVIGGVGIANITVAAIVERTREIGLRRAIGATDLEIMAQFITEAALLSLLGGGLGVVTVHGLTKAATNTIFEAPYSFNWQDAALSMGAAFTIGVGASFFPALRITQIDVVQALRGE